MSSETFIDDWNQTFPSSKIHPNDLASPTEAFLTRNLITMLRGFFIDISPSDFECTDPDSFPRAKMHLFQYVNDLYRSLTHKKFHYFDLIHPTPKKTLNLLHTLLNYVLYYQMVEEEVTLETQEIIQRRRELVAKKNKMVSEREKNKVQVQEGQRRMEASSKLLEELTKKVVEEQKNPCLKEFEDNVQLKSKNAQKMAGLKIHISELMSLCIDEDDYSEMKSSIFQTQEVLSEKQEALEKLTTNHENLCMEISNLEQRISMLESVGDLVPDGKIIRPGELSDKKERLIRTMIAHEENQKKIEEMKEKVEQCQQEVIDMQKRTIAFNEELSLEIEANGKSLDGLEAQVRGVKESLQSSKANVDESKLEIKLMKENAKVGLHWLRKSHISDVELDENSPPNF